VKRAADAADGSGIAVGSARVHPHASDGERTPQIEERLRELSAAVDLSEPFERIRAAIDEAQRH
jgi:hypothetical protein